MGRAFSVGQFKIEDILTFTHGHLQCRLPGVGVFLRKVRLDLPGFGWLDADRHSVFAGHRAVVGVECSERVGPSLDRSRPWRVDLYRAGT